MYYSYIWILIPFMLLSLLASMIVKNTFNKYLKVENSRRMTGYEVAQRIATANNLYISIEMLNSDDGDHYDPTSRTVRLSRPVYNGTSVTSLSVASHEVGHAIQHEMGYSFLRFRTAMFPVVNIASSSWSFIFLLGIFMGLSSALGTFFMQLSIALFSAVVLFQVITLPVEFDASARALKQMKALGLVGVGDEYKGSKRVLQAAAFTYVAAALASVASLVRLILISRRD